MRVLGFMVAAALTSASCAHPRTLRDGGIGLMALGGGTAGIAGMLCLPYAFPAPQDEDPDKDDNLRACRNIALAGGILFAIGLPLLLYGQAGVTREDQAERTRRHDEGVARYEQLEQQQRATSDRVSAATNEAVIAARAGNCDLVRVHARYVFNLDPQYFTNVFLRDPAIDSCHPKSGDPDRDRERAFALVKMAKTAAVAGDCTVATGLDAKIRDLDEHVYKGWFVIDDAIKPCLSRRGATQNTP